uniref:GINS subunit domain-containing protein n=1 Tax=Bicosoecida sp. CB-2014 TaxID=1486930 RepID=A0A7S1C9Q6_9STRA|mmetsp:Transcript_18774/g.66306  ORF Transcript_18774/g.66306 Transcript_18774/m.66306 type:complete len:200 (+) Transcript_18774:161-760(+)
MAAGGGMYGSKAKALLMELQRSDWLPSYNDEAIRQVVEEINALHAELVDTLEREGFEVADVAVACGMLVQHESMLRNKRCVLAYLQARLEKIQAMRWETGAMIPPHCKRQMSAKEVDFAHQYDKLVTAYVRDVKIDITADLEPPKDLLVEVQVLKDCGEIWTDSGPVTLDKHSRHFLRRSDVEHLIRQGMVRQTDTEAA